MVDELPEEAIEEAEGVEATHSHDAVSPEDGSLVEHLRAEHGLDTDVGFSRSTQEGLHDRLHHEAKAVDD
jgi:hypothetical protein